MIVHLPKNGPQLAAVAVRVPCQGGMGEKDYPGSAIAGDVIGQERQAPAGDNHE